MAKYKLEKSNAAKKFYRVEFVNLPSEASFWEDCKVKSKKDKIKVRFAVRKTTKNLKEVTHAVVEYSDGDIWYYSLLTDWK